VRRSWVPLALTVLLPIPVASGGEVGTQVFSALKEMPRVRVIVALREPTASATDLSLRSAEVSAVQQNVLEGLAPGDFILTHRYAAISAVGGEVSLSGLQRLLLDPDVLQVDVDPPAFAQLAESGSLMRVDQVHAAGVTGRGVVVAVLDTGVDTRHADIKDSLIAEQCFCTSPSGAGCCPNGAASQGGAGSAEDDQGHGTNVTGIITGNGRVAPRGIAPDAQIVAVKVLDKAGAGTSTSILAGLDYLITQRPEVKVVNLSLGLANLFSGACDSAASFTTAFASAVNSLKGRGASLFASSANNGSSSQIAVPACIQNAIAVGAVYDGDTGTITFGCTDATTSADKIACFSNSSSAVDVLAPGAPITSAGIGGGVSTFLGTSQACPEAAAAAALLLEARPSLSPDQVEAALKNTGRPITDSRNGLGFKRIDVKAAVDSVR
jgi:subtilisin family serine protease